MACVFVRTIFRSLPYGVDLGHECSCLVPLHGNPRATGTFIRTFIHLVVPIVRVLQKQLAFFSEVATMLLHGVTSILRRWSGDAYKHQCCDLGLGDFNPDASSASLPNSESSIGYVAMKSANDAQQDFIPADGELRNHDSSLIFRKYVNCPVCTVVELQQGTHLGQNKP